MGGSSWEPVALRGRGDHHACGCSVVAEVAGENTERMEDPMSGKGTPCQA